MSFLVSVSRDFELGRTWLAGGVDHQYRTVLIFKSPPPAEAICFRFVRPCRCPCVRDSRGSFMFLRYLQYLLTDSRQTFVTGASWDTDDLFTFLCQKVKVQGHTIAAEAHSTRRYRRVQLFLVYTVLSAVGSNPVFIFLCNFIVDGSVTGHIMYTHPQFLSLRRR